MQADLVEQRRGARRRRRAAPAISIGTRTFSSAVSDGIRWKNWKTKPIFSPRSRASASSPSARDVDAVDAASRPCVGASRPAISPSSVDLPLPDGPTIATNWPAGTIEVERMQDGQRRAAAGHCLRDTAQFDHSVDSSAAEQGASARQMVGHGGAPFRGRVNAVALIQRRDARHAVEEERHQATSYRLGEIAIRLAELRV